MEERDPLLSQAYREANHAEPPPALDNAILAAARQALATPPRRRAARFAWAVPLSTAAVLVLGVTLLFQMQRESPETPREAKPAPATARLESTRTLPSNAQGKTETEHMEATSAASTGATAEPRPAPFPAVPPLPRPEQARKAPVAAQADSFATEATTRMERSTPFASTAPAAREAAPAPNPERPEQWVEKIRLLLREGRTDEARKSLEELRRRHPGFALPEDLLAIQ